MSLKPTFASQILSYTGSMTHYYGDAGITKRLQFEGDPKKGDASIFFSAVRDSDKGTYMCKVKMAPGVDARKVSLEVLGEEELFFTSFTCFLSTPIVGFTCYSPCYGMWMLPGFSSCLNQ